MGMDGALSYLAEAAALPVGGVLAAGVVWTLGVRGRRIDDHHLCRRCGYDLFGADHSICPECGADVTAPRAVRVGHRRRRRGLIVTALVLTLVSGVALVVLGHGAVRAWEDPANRPTWWLLRELNGDRNTPRNRAFDELARRHKRNELRLDQVRRVTDSLLAWQADPLVRWAPQFGDFVEAARRQGVLGDEDWSRYFRQGVDLRLTTRPRVRRGEAPQYNLAISPARFSSTTELRLNYAVSFRIDGVRLPAEAGFQSTPTLGAGAIAWQSGRLRQSVDTPEGMHTLQADVQMSVSERALRRENPPAASWATTLTSAFQTVPPGTSTVELDRSPEVQARMERSIVVRQLVWIVKGKMLRVELGVKSVPIDVAADVIVRAGEREWRARTDIRQGGGWGLTRVIVKGVDMIDAPRADVIVRGSAEAASDTLDMTRVWGGELLFKDVPVTASEVGVPPPSHPPVAPTTQPVPGVVGSPRDKGQVE